MPLQSSLGSPEIGISSMSFVWRGKTKNIFQALIVKAVSQKPSCCRFSDISGLGLHTVETIVSLLPQRTQGLESTPMWVSQTEPYTMLQLR